MNISISKMVSLVMLALALVSCKDKLQLAAAEGDAEAVRNLLDSGTDPSQRTRALTAAAQHGHGEIVRMLIVGS